MQTSELWVMILTHPQAQEQQQQRKKHKPRREKRSLAAASGIAASGGGGTSHPQQQQKAFHVSIVAQPLLAAARHNQRISEATDMHGAAPFCYPIRILGPFITEARAQRFAHTLIQGTRGLASLCRRLELLLAWPAFNNVQCYSQEVALATGSSDENQEQPQLLATYLASHGAPEYYRQVARRLDDAAHVLSGHVRFPPNSEDSDPMDI